MTDPQIPHFDVNAGQRADPEATRQAVAAIMARDPQFNVDAFLAEAQQAFWLVGQAHATCKPDLCLGVLSPSLGERQRASIEKACGEGHVLVPGDGDGESGQLVSITTDANHDTAIVHFTSSWKPAAGGRGKEEHQVENWCFQRPSTAQTSRASSSDRCHNCGGALASSAGGTCRFCGTPVGTGDGWRVIRIDEVQAQEAAAAVAAMQSIVAGMGGVAGIAGMVAAARQASTGPSPPVAVPSSQGRRRRGRGCVGPVFFLLLVLVGGAIYAVKSSGSLHDSVAKVVPSIRHSQLQGPLDLSGAIVAQQVAAVHVQPVLQPLGSCAQAAKRTTWDFKANLPDGSTFHLLIALPPGTSTAGPFKPPQLTVAATARNAASSLSWGSIPTTPATLAVTDGGGDLKFTGLISSRTTTGPLSGHLIWTCALA